MFGIIKIHVGVVKELVLAKANVNIKNRVSRNLNRCFNFPLNISQVYNNSLVVFMYA